MMSWRADSCRIEGKCCCVCHACHDDILCVHNGLDCDELFSMVTDMHIHGGKTLYMDAFELIYASLSFVMLVMMIYSFRFVIWKEKLINKKERDREKQL